jgi:hypothetical protein
MNINVIFLVLNYAYALECGPLGSELIQNAGSEVLSAVIMNVAIFWDIALCSPSSETSAHIQTTQRYIPEEGKILNLACLLSSLVIPGKASSECRNSNFGRCWSTTCGMPKNSQAHE